MTDSSVRIPEISERHDGREIDCEITERNGASFYRQRVSAIPQNSMGQEITQMNSALQQW